MTGRMLAGSGLWHIAAMSIAMSDTALAHLTTSLSAGTILLGLGLGFKATYIGLRLECSGLGINHKAIRHGI